MEPWELIEKLKLELDEIKKERQMLKETNFKLLGRLSVYTERIERYEIALNQIAITKDFYSLETISDYENKAKKALRS